MQRACRKSAVFKVCYSQQLMLPQSTAQTIMQREENCSIPAAAAAAAAAIAVRAASTAAAAFAAPAFLH